MSKVLITGGAGFLGSHLVESFLKDDFNVTVLDDLSTGSMKNLDPYINNSKFNFIKWDVREKYPINEKFDFILNFACPASPVHYQSNPVKTIETCFDGMKNALHQALDHGGIVLQASTSEIYGDPTITPQNEEYWGNVNPIGIRSCYDEGKRAAETLCFDFLREHEIDVRVIRIFNTYGPNMARNDGRVVSNFINQALTNSDITIYGDGTQTRSFCYVTDLILGIRSFLNLDINPKIPINLGNPTEFTMLELAEKIIQLTNSNSKLNFQDLPLDDPKQRKPDIKKANEILDWNPIVEIGQGLEATIKYFQET